MRVPSLLALATLYRHPAKSCNIAGLVVACLLAPLFPSEAGKVGATVVGGILLCFGRWEGRTPFDLPVLCFLVSAAVSTAFSSGYIGFVPSMGRGDGYVVWAVYGLLAMAAARLSRQDAERLWGGILLLGVVQCAIVILQVLGLDLSRVSTLPPENRPYGTLSNPIFVGAFLAALVPGFACWPWAPYWTGGALVGVILSASRVAIGASAIGFILSTWRRWTWDWTAGTIFVTVWVSAFLLQIGPHVAMGHYTDASSGGGRWVIWQFVAPLVLKHPFFGYGLSTMYIVGLPGFAGSIVDNPHDEILYVAWAFGLVGLGLYLGVWVTSLRNGPLRLPLLILAACLFFSWSHIGLANVMWTILGLTYPLSRHILSTPSNHSATSQKRRSVLQR